MKHQKPNILKLCLMGEGGVGKTTLCSRLITGLFNPTTKMTIGIDFQLMRIEILDPFSDDAKKIPLEVQIWDFGGEDRFRFMLPRFVQGATGGLLLYDLSRFSTQKYLNEWLDIWKSKSDKLAPLYLIGSKSDCLDKSQISEANKHIKNLADSNGIKKTFLTSSKSGYSIDTLIDSIVKEMYVYNKKKLDL